MTDPNAGMRPPPGPAPSDPAGFPGNPPPGYPPQQPGAGYPPPQQPGAGYPPPQPGGSQVPGGQPTGVDSRGRVQRTRISGVWIALIASAIVLILLVIFIAQNLDEVSVHFIGFSGRISLSLALLIAAVCGVAIAAIPGTIRILQLRRALRRTARAAQAQRQAPPR